MSPSRQRKVDRTIKEAAFLGLTALKTLDRSFCDHGSPEQEPVGWNFTCAPSGTFFTELQAMTAIYLLASLDVF